MTGCAGKIQTGDERPLVEVRQESGKMLCFQRIGVSWSRSGTCIGRVDSQTC